MDIASKIVFLLSKKEYLIVTNKEGAPELIYRNGERYTISGYMPNEQTLEIFTSSVQKIHPPNTPPHHSDEKIITDLTNHMKKINISIIKK